MNIKDFGKLAAGSISEITPFWGGKHCFDPEPLPPAWEFPTELWPLLNEAVAQLMLLEGVGRSLPNPTILLGPMRDREAILSSRMEGTFATPQQLLLYELEPIEASTESDPRNQFREVANYVKALEHADSSSLPTGLLLIRQMHERLLDGVRGENKEPGRFRRQQVAIGSDARFVPPPPERLTDFLDELDAYLAAEDRRFHPLVVCFLIHYQFETIHPFSDGNGRVGRLLLTHMIKQQCSLTMPWLHMSEYFSRDHGGYCNYLYRVSCSGEWQNWIEYCLQGVVRLAGEAVLRCDRLRRLRDEHFERLSKTRGAVRLHGIVEGLYQTPVVTIASLPEAYQVTYPTAKADVEKLVKLEILSEWPDKHPKTYYAPEIFDIAYEGL
ncbi:Adenosine monophosphate-protein transferase SoFic [Posidoniimonas polymericola]|uniref:Adenosine monophosphate-protein transferase SoFic n=1 Tax=Posidoniimonas polymericola TaxID=2528002 RepID=A0A5C5ZG78_9BACT|nr:Fic family protein [Posidoniimonas polymericola]TWT85881.1 Adenosine monophosphate-protein transferase SoFic [Posidoniimonas polymericola]